MERRNSGDATAKISVALKPYTHAFADNLTTYHPKTGSAPTLPERLFPHPTLARA